MNHTGTLRRDGDDVVAEVTDCFGMRQTLTFRKAEGTYELVGFALDVPADLAVPWVDFEP